MNESTSSYIIKVMCSWNNVWRFWVRQLTIDKLIKDSRAVVNRDGAQEKMEGFGLKHNLQQKLKC